MIVITGAAGFIGSCLAGKLNENGVFDLVLADDFSNQTKADNINTKKIKEKVERSILFNWLEQNHENVNFVLHIGARTDTTEFRKSVFDELNVNYSKQVWNFCTRYQIPLIYASSAATYGLGELGYSDDHALIPSLKPLNPYGNSKNEFDKWVLQQNEQPPLWYGLKFFNVYGPNEYHKGRMASVIFHAFHQVRKTGKVKLFKSHRPDFTDGGQLRDFVYVKDVVSVILFLMNKKGFSGIYNLGTGKARTFLDLAANTFKALEIPENIEFIDTPIDIRDKYQYFTQADMTKLFSIGYQQPFFSLEEGIADYVKNFLVYQEYL
ncbi:MAG: ADP-glyceromanno-heptose 6-epimerase [Lentimicrobiaceae bacterium]|jgi:ADP-L-glycero-D-manno-heptose 6-epimerase|nr:ADP-glyceromanno-heptose 6-epimerase [Lentimicrobiaceae bacterium]